MSTGEDFEALAARHLSSAGLTVRERNYRCRCGEIDLVCEEGDTLVFVEVRARLNPRYASAAASVTAAKQQRLLRTAQRYLQQRGWSDRRHCRFDVIAFSRDGLSWIRNAFTL